MIYSTVLLLENSKITNVWIGVGCGAGVLLISALVTVILVKTQKRKSSSNNTPIKGIISLFSLELKFYRLPSKLRVIDIFFKLITIIMIILDAEYDDGNIYDSVDPGDTNRRMNRIAANTPSENVIENPYYGDEDDVINTVNANISNVQNQDPGFISVTVVDNLYYQ